MIFREITIKKIIYIFMIIFTLSNTACKKAPLKSQVIAERLQQEVDFGKLQVLDKDGLKRVYNIKVNVDDFAAYISPSRIGAWQLLIIRDNNEKKIKDIKSQLEGYANLLEKQNLLPDSLKDIKNRTIFIYNDYLVFAISMSGDVKTQAIKIIDSDLA